MLEAVKQQVDKMQGKNSYYFPNDTRFTRFQGTKKKREKKLITTASIEDINKDIKEFFVDKQLIDVDSKAIKSEDPFDSNNLGAKNAKSLATKINTILKEANIDKKATTGFFSPNSITLNGTQYTFRQDQFDYNKFLKDLNVILKQGGVSQNTDLNPNVEEIQD